MGIPNSFAKSAMAVSALLVLSIAASTAQADAIIYKYTGRDGVTVYSQTLPESHSPGDVQTVRVESLPPQQQRAAVRMLDTLNKNANDKAASLVTRLDIADRNIAAAIKNLQHAEQNLKKGSELVGGDRVANFDGGSRIREEYFLRVSQLQGAVEQAKQALDQAYVERDNLR